MPYSIVSTGPVGSATSVSNRYRLVAGEFSVRNDQSKPGATYPVRVSVGGAEQRLALPAGHTAGFALRIDAGGNAYGWSMGRVSGRARYHAVVWPFGTTAPTVIDAQDSEAIGPSDLVPGGVVVHRRTANGQQGSLFVVGDGGVIVSLSNGTVPGAVVTESGPVGAVVAGLDLSPSVWFEGVQTPLHAPPVDESAVATCALGSLVFGYRVKGAAQFAVMWDLQDGGTITDIPAPSGLSLRQVLGVYTDGSIEGVANDSSGALVAFVGTPV